MNRDNLNRAYKRVKANKGAPVAQLKSLIWLNYFAIASMKKLMADWNGWLRRRIRMYIWKQWKKPRTKFRNLLKLGITEKYAWMAAMSRRGYWFTVETGAVEWAISNERLARAGLFDLSLAYESIQAACVGRAVYRTVRTVCPGPETADNRKVWYNVGTKQKRRIERNPSKR